MVKDKTGPDKREGSHLLWKLKETVSVIFHRRLESAQTKNFVFVSFQLAVVTAVTNFSFTRCRFALVKVQGCPCQYFTLMHLR